MWCCIASGGSVTDCEFAKVFSGCVEMAEMTIVEIRPDHLPRAYREDMAHGRS